MSAERIASHFVGPAAVCVSIDAELSSMTYMSSGSRSAFCDCAAHAASPSGALPTARGGGSTTAS